MNRNIELLAPGGDVEAVGLISKDNIDKFRCNLGAVNIINKQN